MPRFEQGHALIIGVGQYQEPFLRAPVTKADASGVAKILKDQALGGYPPDQVELLHDEQSSKAAVKAAFQRLAQRTTSSDTAFVFFCGHGGLGEDGLYYFMTHDTALTSGSLDRLTEPCEQCTRTDL